MSNTAGGTTLLERHNPVLVLFPQEPNVRARPGAWRPGARGWGDYHPCSVQFFLARAHLRSGPPGYDPRDLLRWSWKPLVPTGLDAIRERLRGVEPEQTRGWELDVAEIPSQNETRAWRVYAALLDRPDDAHPYACVVYGRHVKAPRPALQYWYLYLYNDFRNNHEADWEMVTIELSPDGKPLRVGLSSHHGGSRREWPQVRKVGERPLVHVAIGSHANYFEYRPRGYHVLDLIFRSNAPPFLGWLAKLAQHMPRLRRLRDLPPADSEFDAGPDPRHKGVRVSPELVPLPDSINQEPDSGHWWLRYRGKWGSTRPRIAGTVGIDTPWGDEGHDPRWEDPVAWLAHCREDAAKPVG